MPLSRSPAVLAAVAAIAIAACTAPEARPPAQPRPGSSEPGGRHRPRGEPPVDAKPRGGALTVRFLDVGQGDAALLTTSDHHAMLLDAGPPEAASRVAAALDALGGEVLDYVVLSHPHSDHLGDLGRTTEALRLRMWIDPGFARPKFHPYAEALQHLDARHIPHKAARRGEHLALGAFVTLAVLEPEDPLIAHTRSDINANSVVLRVDHRGAHGDARFLFEGDAEHATEQRLLADPASLRADVLKVAHHGSRFASSDAVLDAVAPRLAVISCATGNDYGHPHAATLARLAKHHVEVARTDLEGTVTVTSNDKGLAWTTERPATPEALGAPGVGRHADAAP